MTIWVDADACPKAIKEILCKAAHKRKILLVFVANQYITTPPSPFISSVQVSSGFDVADNHIVEKVSANDLVITQDIPLAADAIAKGALVINTRGEMYTKDNIEPRLTMRNFMEQMRSSGERTGGPAPFNHQDKQSFANALDRWISKQA